MPNIIGPDGLQIATIGEIRAQLNARFREIYGTDINIDQNSPDGQIIGIFAQLTADYLEMLQGVYNSFNPDRAVGRLLDERVVINNIQRAGGTFTIQPVDITVDRTVTLQGLDALGSDINGTGYTVQDNAGTQFILLDSITLTPGTYSLNFRAQQIGQVETVVGTINNPVTIVLGVTGIDNSSPALEIGQNEETDAQLRLRRSKSPSIKSTGYLNGLLAQVLSLPGVTEAKLYENVSNVTDSNGIPAHGIWLVAEGGANSDIAQSIYAKKSYGANMKGAVEVDITTPSGEIFTAKFDRPTAANLWVRFDAYRTVTGSSIDDVSIKQYMVDNTTYEIGEYADTSRLTTIAAAAIDATGGNAVPINMEISDDGISWVDFLDAPTLDSKWLLDPSRIAITVI